MAQRDDKPDPIGIEAGREARKRTLELLRSKGPSLEATLRELKKELKAKEVKAKYQPGYVSGDEWVPGEWQYSKKLVSHGPRLKAIELILQLYDVMPSQKHEIELTKETLAALINTLPAGIAEAVRGQLASIVSGKRNR